MLLTIHNLPSSTRYADVKTLLEEKCGLTDIIVDNLVNEGKTKKVTVGLANEDDGAFVVRKLNGLYINGQQLYIEHKRRNATVQEQPYRPPVSLIQESRGFEQAHINNMMQTAVAPNAPNWNQNVTAPYMSIMPIDQSVAYSAYVAVPQASHYMVPLPVPAENEQRYSGFQGESFIPAISSEGPGHQAPDWGRNGMEPPSDALRRDRKRHHSPDRPAAPKLSRKETRILAAQKRREETARVELPRQWSEPNQGPRPPLRQPEPLPRNQYQNVDDRYPRNQQQNVDDRYPRNQQQNVDDRYPRNQQQNVDNRFPRNQQQNEDDQFPRNQHQNVDDRFPRNQHQNVDDRFPRNQHQNVDDRFPRNQHQNVDDRFPRNQHQNVDDRFPRNQHQNVDDRFPRKQHQNVDDRFSRNQHQNVDGFPRNQQQNIDDRFQPREPSPPYHHTVPQWEPNRWDEPKPNPRSEREREWGNDNHENWATQPVKVWDTDTTPEQQWREKPSPWDKPKPQWEGNYSRVPVEDNRPERYDHPVPVGSPRGNSEFHPREQGQYRESRPRKSRFDDRNSGPNRNGGPDKRSGSGPAASSNRQGKPVEEMQRRDRPQSKNIRQERVWRDDKPNAPRDRSGGPKNPEFGRQGPKNYHESKRQLRPEFTSRHAMLKHERDAMYKRQPFVKEEKNYPPRRQDKKPDSLRAMINRDQTNRGQATALIAKTVMGLKTGVSYFPKSPFDTFLFKELKRCIRARVDVELGEELCTDIDEGVRKYRTKYPINQDKALLKQIREKATKEYEQNQEKVQDKKSLIEEEIKETKIKIEALEKEAEESSQKEDILNQATLEVKNDSNEHKETKDADATKDAKIPVPPVPPNMPKAKSGKPLTDKQIIQQMKLQRKWEYDQDDVYSLDEVNHKALDDEMAKLEKFFTEECSKPADSQEATICKIITTNSLNDFNKTIRLYVTKRLLNIPTGLTIRILGQGKLPRKTAMKEYLKKYRINNLTIKKSVKSPMFLVNLNRFEDFDNLCRIEHDVIDGIPVSFKAMHLTGPPSKITRNQVKAMRERFIREQIDQNVDLGEFEDAADNGGVENEEKDDLAETEEVEESKEFEESENFTEDDDAGNFEGEDFAADTTDVTEDIEDINIGSINEEDLEDF